MKTIAVLVLKLIMLLAFVACSKKDDDKMAWVASRRVLTSWVPVPFGITEVYGWNLLVKMEGEKDWTFRSDHLIEGFVYEEGYSYRLLVRDIEEKYRRYDGGPTYMLIKTLEKKKAIPTDHRQY